MSCLLQDMKSKHIYLYYISSKLLTLLQVLDLHKDKLIKFFTLESKLLTVKNELN